MELIKGQMRIFDLIEKLSFPAESDMVDITIRGRETYRFYNTEKQIKELNDLAKGEWDSLVVEFNFFPNKCCNCNKGE